MPFSHQECVVFCLYCLLHSNDNLFITEVSIVMCEYNREHGVTFDATALSIYYIAIEYFEKKSTYLSYLPSNASAYCPFMTLLTCVICHLPL